MANRVARCWVCVNLRTRDDCFVELVRFHFPLLEYVNERLTKTERRLFIMGRQATPNSVLTSSRYREHIMSRCFGAFFRGADSIGVVINDVTVERIFGVGSNIGSLKQTL